MTRVDLNDLLRYLYHARRVLQALAALLASDECCDMAGDLDELASVAWEAARC